MNAVFVEDGNVGCCRIAGPGVLGIVNAHLLNAGTRSRQCSAIGQQERPAKRPACMYAGFRLSGFLTFRSLDLRKLIEPFLVIASEEARVQEDLYDFEREA